MKNNGRIFTTLVGLFLFTACSSEPKLEEKDITLLEGEGYIRGVLSSGTLAITSPKDGATVPLEYDAALNCSAGAIIEFWEGSLVNNGQRHTCPSTGKLTVKLKHQLTSASWRGFAANQYLGATNNQVNITLKIDPALSSPTLPGSTPTPLPTTSPVPTVVPTSVPTTPPSPTPIPTAPAPSGQNFSIVSPLQNSTVGKAFTLTLNCISGATITLWNGSLVNNGQSFTCPINGSTSRVLEYNVTAATWGGVTILHNSASKGAEQANLSVKIDPSLPSVPTPAPTASPNPTSPPNPTPAPTIAPTMAPTPIPTAIPSPSPIPSPTTQIFTIVSPAQYATVSTNFTLTLTCITSANITLWNGDLVNNGQQHMCPSTGFLALPLQFTTTSATWGGVTIQHNSASKGVEQINLALRIDPVVPTEPKPAPTPSPSPVATPSPIPSPSPKPSPSDSCTVSTSPEMWGLMGQSNAVGLPRDGIAYPTLAASVAQEYKANGDKLVPLADPLGDFIGPNFAVNGFDCLSGSDMHSSGYAFAKRYNQLTGHQVIMVHAAQGGTSLLVESDLGAGSWLNDTQCIRRSALEKLRRAKLKSNAPYKGTLWYQGETDSVVPTVTLEAYKNGLRTFVELMYRETGAPIYSVIPGYMAAVGAGPHDPGVERTKRAQLELQTEPAMAGKFYVVYDVTQLRQYGTTYYVDKPGDSFVHLNSAGLDVVGNKSAEAIATLKGCPPAP